MQIVTYQPHEDQFIPTDNFNNGILSSAYVYTIDHPGCSNTKMVRTSAVKSADHARGIFVTQNSIYVPNNYVDLYETNFQAIMTSLVSMYNTAQGAKNLASAKQTIFEYLNQINPIADDLDYCLVSDVRGFVLAVTVINDEHQILDVVWEVADEDL